MKQLVFLLFFQFPLLCLAQITQLNGEVIDADTQEKIVYATVAIYNNEKLIDGVSTDEDGMFELIINEAFTHIEISFIGYQTYRLALSEGENKKNIKVLLVIDPNKLEEVLVEGKLTTTQVKIDRKIINLGSDIQQAGVNALEAFEQIPEIQTDISTGIISLRGSNNVRILVNGKLSPLNSSELLQQIPSSNIKRIEIITSPSAKNRADGLSGIINILLKKNNDAGLNLGVTSSVGTRRYGLGLNGNYNIAWANFRLNTSKTNLRTINEQLIKREFSNGNTETIFTPYRFDGDVNTISSGIDFFINDKHEVSLDFEYTDDSHSNFNESAYTNVTNSDDFGYLRESNHFHYISILNANYRLKFNEDSFLEIDYNINDSKNDYPLSDFVDDSLLFNQFLTEDFVLQSFATDYTFSVEESIKIETGASINSQVLKSTRMFNPIDGLEENDTFNYDESLWGVYAQAKFSIKEIDVQAGFRFENFKTKSISVRNNFRTNQSFSNLFPSIHFSYPLNDANTLNAGYSRRVSRPDFHQVNAFQIVNPLFIWEYNPNITPEFSDTIELSYQGNTKGFNLGLSAFYRKRSDVILWIESSENNQQVFRYENSGIFNSYGFESTVSIKVKSYWDARLSANYYFTKINQRDIVTWNKTYSSALQFKNTFDITKKITADVTYLFNPKRQNPFSYDESRKRLDVAFRGKFFDNKMTFGLRIVDLFNTNHFRRISRTQDLMQITDWDIQTQKRNFLLSLNYTLFENKILERNRKKRRYNKAPIN